VRLHKYIANCGYVSRRRAELLIRAGRVQVNGRTVTEVGTSIHTPRDRVIINGDLVEPPARVTIVLHKLQGFITSTHDTHERLTVMDLLPRRMQELGVKPVGRLDQGTSGLLVLTNDGDLNHHLTHPRYEIEKEYQVEVEGRPNRAALERVEQGIVIEGERTAPARISDVKPLAGSTRLSIVISEGRKRQIKKMFEAVGHQVLKLSRVRLGGLLLGDLSPGAWRELNRSEVELLLRSPTALPLGGH